MARRRKGKRQTKHSKYKDYNISDIDQHKRHRKTLTPPLAQLPGPVEFSSWSDDVLPNMMWACILAAHLDRKHYLQLFRSVIIAARENLSDYEKTFVSHSRISQLKKNDFDIMFSPIFADEQATQLLSALLLLDCLPDRELWEPHLSKPETETEMETAWSVLGRAVAYCLDHQSQTSTDVRWLRLMHFTVMGRMKYPEAMRERVEELRLYPDRGDMRAVRPFIRAGEMSTRQFESSKDDSIDAPQPPAPTFWKECYAKTACFAAPSERFTDYDARKILDELVSMCVSLSEHFELTNDDTRIDPRHDGAFALAFYAIFLTFEATRAENHVLVSGRLLLRSVVESFITLRYLAAKDDPTLWKQYRTYGSGQVKLAFLKNIRDEDTPGFIDLESLMNLANEDKWMEFQDIDLGSWADLNLRTMSEQSNCKEVYDRYFDILSGYAHAQWAFVRDTVFTTCMNPLHRLHRIPAPQRPQKSVIVDCCKIVNGMLDDLNFLYPTFKPRLKEYKNIEDEFSTTDGGSKDAAADGPTEE